MDNNINNKYLYHSNYIILIDIIKAIEIILEQSDFTKFLNFILYNNQTINNNSLIEFICHLLNLNYYDYEFLFDYIDKSYNYFINTYNIFSYKDSKKNVFILNKIIKKMYEYFDIHYGCQNLNYDLHLSIIIPSNIIKNESGKSYYKLYTYFKYHVIHNLSNHFLYLSCKMKYEKALFELSIILIHKKQYQHAYNCLTSTHNNEKIENIFEIKYIPSLVILSFFYLNGVIVNKNIDIFNTIKKYCLESYNELNKKHNCFYYLKDHWDTALKINDIFNN